MYKCITFPPRDLTWDGNDSTNAVSQLRTRLVAILVDLTKANGVSWVLTLLGIENDYLVGVRWLDACL